MDADLDIYEWFSASHNCKQNKWAIYLSALLTGKGLQVYTSMPPDDANDFGKLNDILGTKVTIGKCQNR